MSQVERIHPPLGGGGGGTPSNPTEVVPLVYDTLPLANTGDGALFRIKDAAGVDIPGPAGLLGFFITMTANVSPFGTPYTVRFLRGGVEMAKAVYTPTALSDPLSAVFPGYQSGIHAFGVMDVSVSGGVVGDVFAVIPYIGSIGKVP